jgi:type II secretory pathway component PulF
MSLFITPGQFARRAEFYRQMGQLTAAGLPLTNALGQLQRTTRGKRSKSRLGQVVRLIEQGSTFSEAMAAPSGWLPAFDLALLQAGEQSGRLDSRFHMLADYYEDRARIARQVIAGLAYPVFLLHFFVFIMPFPQFFLSGDWKTYLLAISKVLLPLYAIVAVVILAGQSRHGESWRSFIERLTGLIPVLGKARRELAIARLASSLEALLSAGITVIEAWQLAAHASGSPRLQRAVARWQPQLAAGQTPAEVIQNSSVLPEIFAGQYATGEVSGNLEETLRLMHRYYQDQGVRKLDELSRWVPVVIYIVIVLVIAYKILSFWMDYFEKIGNVL